MMWKVFENIYFGNFGDFVNWFGSYSPLFIIITFVINVIFSVISELTHFGGGKK